MKTIFTFLMLPLIVLICFFSAKLYISGQYAAAYTLVAAWFSSIIFWIHQVGMPLQKERA
ncbi:MAG TPA: hypothetical protein VL832_30160 [Puia sp.]|nr:hypothetical protein [Puia sp.]